MKHPVPAKIEKPELTDSKDDIESEGLDAFERERLTTEFVAMVYEIRKQKADPEK